VVSGGGAQFVISAAAVVTGGSLVQGIIFILRRKTDLSHVDANTEKVRVEAERIRTEIAQEVAEGLAAEAKRQASRNLELEDRIEKLREQIGKDREKYELRIAAEILASAGLLGQVAELRNELGIARRQIAILEGRLNARDN
jgi:hypothetical protein